MQLTKIEAEIYFSDRYKMFEIPNVPRIYTNVEEIDLVNKRVFLRNGVVSLVDFQEKTNCNIVENLQQITEIREMYLENLLGIYGPTNGLFDFYIVYENKIFYLIDKKTNVKKQINSTYILENLKINVKVADEIDFTTKIVRIVDIPQLQKLLGSRLTKIDFDNQICIIDENIYLPFQYLYEFAVIPYTYLILRKPDYNYLVFEDLSHFCNFFNLEILEAGDDAIQLQHKVYDTIYTFKTINQIEDWFGCKITNNPEYKLYPIHYYVLSDITNKELYMDDFEWFGRISEIKNVYEDAKVIINSDEKNMVIKKSNESISLANLDFLKSEIGVELE